MFRTDRDALAQEVEDLRRERAQLQAQNEAMRSDILARRHEPLPSPGPGNVYRQGTAHLSPGERVALAQHSVEAFPVWAAVLLHLVTFGLFSLVHFSALHDKLPRAERDDPSTPRAIGFSFIPYFAFYWIPFNAIRLADRLNLQTRLRGLPDAMPRWLAITAGVLGVIPYVNVLGMLLAWPFAVAAFQRAANRIAELPRDGSDVADAATGTWTSRDVAQPPLRVPLVRDLPGPDDAVGTPRVADDAVAEQAEVEADAAARTFGARR